MGGRALLLVGLGLAALTQRACSGDAFADPVGPGDSPENAPATPTPTAAPTSAQASAPASEALDLELAQRLTSMALEQGRYAEAAQRAAEGKARFPEHADWFEVRAELAGDGMVLLAPSPTAAPMPTSTPRPEPRAPRSVGVDLGLSSGLRFERYFADGGAVEEVGLRVGLMGSTVPTYIGVIPFPVPAVTGLIDFRSGKRFQPELGMSLMWGPEALLGGTSVGVGACAALHREPRPGFHTSLGGGAGVWFAGRSRYVSPVIEATVGWQSLQPERRGR